MWKEHLRVKLCFHWEFAIAFAGAEALMLNLLINDFNGDAPAPAKMGTEPIPIFTFPLLQMLSGNGPLLVQKNGDWGGVA